MKDVDEIRAWVNRVAASIVTDDDERTEVTGIRLSMIEEANGHLTLWVEREDVPTMAEARA